MTGGKITEGEGGATPLYALGDVNGAGRAETGGESTVTKREGVYMQDGNR